VIFSKREKELVTPSVFRPIHGQADQTPRNHPFVSVMDAGQIGWDARHSVSDKALAEKTAELSLVNASWDQRSLHERSYGLDMGLFCEHLVGCCTEMEKTICRRVRSAEIALILAVKSIGLKGRIPYSSLPFPKSLC